MKRFICHILTSTIASTLSICSIHIANAQGTSIASEEEGLMLQVSTHHLQFSQAGSQDLEIISNTHWEIEVLDPWITTTTNFGEGDQTVTFIVEENEANEARTGEISIVTEGIGRSIIIEQAGRTILFELNLEAKYGILQTLADPYVPAGDSVQLTAVPDDGYVFQSWSGDVEGDENPLKLIMADHTTVKALFTKVDDTHAIADSPTFERPFELTVNQVGQGDTDYTDNYVNGDTITLTAEPKQGWVFVGWTGDRVAETKEIQVVLDKDQSITAAFEKVSYSVSLDSEHGNIQQYPKRGKFFEGERITLVAEPDEGYEFVAWDGIIAQNKKITLPVYSNVEAKAIFRKIADVYTVQVEAEEHLGLKSAVLSKDFRGYSGDGHMTLEEEGAYLEYNVHIPVAGKADFILTYIGADNSQIHLVVNGVLHSSVDLPSYGPYWNLWETTVDLLQGENTLKIVRRKADLAIDYLEITNVIPQPQYGRAASMVIYPNPATNFLNLSIPSDVVITDSKGQPVIEEKNIDRINVEDLEAGLYLLSSEGQVSEVTIKD
ncbi:MAG: T9SS type A sorting domain-containing protein [Bacteroidota bacterium]